MTVFVFPLSGMEWHDLNRTHADKNGLTNSDI